MEPIHTEKAPSAIGTYSQAVRARDFVFISGQIPLDPVTMLLEEADIQGQMTQVFENLKGIAEASGGALSNIVRLTVYLRDLSHFPLVNEVMAHYFMAPYPARAVVEVSALPKNAQVEIDAIMML